MVLTVINSNNIKVFRGVFTTLSSIHDGAFFENS